MDKRVLITLADRPQRGANQPFTGAAISDELYQQIASILEGQQQFQLDGYKVNAIKRRIAARMRAIRQTDGQAYLQWLAESRTEQQQLLQALSIHVSSFFRNPSAFRALEKKILPSLLAEASRETAKLRVWSVGCARGEEAYSLALVCQKLQQQPGQIAIIGTDISAAAIKMARRGSYCLSQLANVSPDQLAHNFTLSGTEYRVTKELRQAVRFFRHDIVAEDPFYRADIILCRNLLIYFSRDQQQKILETLASALSPGGYLMLGRAETLAPDCRGLFQCIDAAERIYQCVKN